MHSRNIMPAIVSGLIGATFAAPSWAQTAPLQESDKQQSARIDEIIVTAQRRAESLQDIPISIVALSSDTLSESGMDTQRLLAQTVPNFQVSNLGLFAAIYLRGVGTTYANPGLEPSVATYFDDQYFSRGSGGMWSFSDVERVEVLKGPQGTLYGRNATGGAVRIISKEPTEVFEGRVSGSLGSHKHRGLEGMVSGPLSDNIRGRLVIQSDQNDGYVRNTEPGRPKMNDRDQIFTRGKLHWDLADNLSAKFSGYYARKQDFDALAFMSIFDAPQQAGLALGGTASPDIHTGSMAILDDTEFRIRNYGLTLRLDYDLDDLRISSITAYNDDKFHGGADLDGTNLSLMNGQTTLSTTKDISQEFQILSAGDGAMEYMAGLFLYQSEARFVYTLAGDFVGPNPVGSDDVVDIQSIAPYGEIYYQFSDAWKLTLGARYTHEEKELSRHHLFRAAGIVNGIEPVSPLVLFSQPSATTTFREFSPRAVVSYEPSNHLMLYLSYSRGFKSGGYVTPFPSPGLVDEVDTEIIDAFEFGWKSSVSGRITFNGALFHYDYKDLQVQTMDETGTNATSNAANAKITGLEADVMVAVTDRLHIGAGAGYLDTEYEDYQGETYLFCSQVPECVASPLGGLGVISIPSDLSGRDLLLAPDLSGYLRLTYEFPVAPHWGFLAGNLHYSYSGSYNYTPDGFLSEDSKGLLSAGLQWRSADDQFEVGLTGQNLTQEKYHTAKAPFTLGGWQVPGAPRTWKLQFTYRFGD
ncbi:MAG: TonB-dependent receptor [Porticoccaceae bacterium]